MWTNFIPSLEKEDILFPSDSLFKLSLVVTELKKNIQIAYIDAMLVKIWSNTL